jgi:hypothetical protein
MGSDGRRAGGDAARRARRPLINSPSKREAPPRLFAEAILAANLSKSAA